MRPIRERFMTVKKMHRAIPFAAFAIVALVVAACGELTGPTSPSTPTGVTATLTNPTTATIAWTPSPLNDGVISYSVFRNGAKVGESTTTSYVDSGLSPQATYVYSVAANCKSGIVSDRSEENAASTVTTVDRTPPTVISNQPPANFVGVSPAATVTATFNENMDPATINATTFTLKVTAGGAAVPGAVTFNQATRTATFTPSSSLANPVNFTATITTGAKDLAGNALATAFSWSFTTRDDTPPSVTATSPIAGATGVAPTTAVNITFSEALDATTVTAANISMRATVSGTAVPGTVTFNAATRVATFTPTATLAQTTGYTVTVAAAIKDAAGNAMAAPFTFAFTTGDTNAPSVTAVVPASGATNVALNTTVKVTFSEPMDPTSITTTTFSLKNTVTSAVIASTVTYDNATTSATLTPGAPLAGNTNYTVTVTTGAKDAAGNPLGGQFTSTFTTLILDSTPPSVTSVNPVNNATGVPISTNVLVSFNEAMDPTTINTTTVTLRNTGTSAVVAGTVTFNSGTNVATFTPSGPLSNATNYTVSVTTGVKDVAGNAIAAQFNSNFTTAALADVIPPTIVSRTPINGATGQAVTTNATVTFSENMDASTINATNITLTTTSGGTLVPATVTCNSPCTTATLDPTPTLAANTSYTLTITTGVKDVAGNALGATSTSTFTTAPDVTAPTVLSRTPTAATGVPVNTTVTFTFSEAMDPTSLNGTTVTLAISGGGAAVTGSVVPSAGNTVVTFTPSANLAPNTSYTATVTTGAKDAAGNALTGNFTFTFTTAP
ncbi:MAG: Ig-like domain-containing protein [Gemmatimonadales bacterium]